MNTNPEILRYRNDSRSATLVYFAILFNVIFFISIYSNFSVVPDGYMGFDIIINILFMLVSFWASEMVKVYQKKWSHALVVLGLIQLIRIFWLPARYNSLDQLVGIAYVVAVSSLFFSALCLVLAYFRSYKLSTILEKYFAQLASKNNEVH